jgi:hypothetical protein
MKPLDEFIRKNPDRFDTDEPLSGHFERFYEKLEFSVKKSSGSLVYTLMKIAAAVILCAMISYAAFREFRIINRNFSEIVTAANYPELNEAEHFYSEQLDIYYSKFKDLRFFNDDTQKQQMLDELSDMDKQVHMLKLDLMKNPEDERIVHAIINSYQVKIELMDLIITRTQESQSAIL